MNVTMHDLGVTVEADAAEVCRIKFGAAGPTGWSPRLRQSFNYFTPDEWYEAALLRLIDRQTAWLDVGCGHQLFPSNAALARLLADRAGLLVGLDPSANIERNPFVHERARCMLEEFRTERSFDVISLRMVAEHIADPQGAVAALARLVHDGGRVVIYTVSKWSPAALAAAATPMQLHHVAKRLLWNTDPEDTFPTVYRMNTRATLRDLFAAGGFDEERFAYLDDCRAFAKWRATARMELGLRRVLRVVGLRYPEVCLLGVYRKRPA